MHREPIMGRITCRIGKLVRRRKTEPAVGSLCSKPAWTLLASFIVMALLCSHCQKRPIHIAKLSFYQTTYCKFCKEWLYHNPLPFKPDGGAYKKKWEEADAAETRREQEANTDWKPAKGAIAHYQENPDTSMRTAYTVMAICGIVGLLAGGPFGALGGAALGYAITAVVMAAQEGTKGL